jgi:hypothetical protein
MTDTAVQIAGIVAGCVTSVVATLYGFKRTSETFEKKLDEKLVTKIDRDTYAAKVKELHGEINGQNIKIAEQAKDIEFLNKQLSELRRE